MSFTLPFILEYYYFSVGELALLDSLKKKKKSYFLSCAVWEITENLLLFHMEKNWFEPNCQIIHKKKIS